MPFITPSMEAELEEMAKAKALQAAERELAAKSEKVAGAVAEAQQGLQAVQRLSSIVKSPGQLADTALGLASNAANAISSKAANTMANAQQGIQVAEKVAGVVGTLGKGSSLANNPYTYGINGPVQGALPVRPVQPTAAQQAASMLPVHVGCEINIDGTIISPIMSVDISQTLGEHNKMIVRFHHELVQDEDALLMEEKAQGLLGKVVEVIIKNTNNPDGDNMEDTFVITDVELDEEGLGGGTLIITCHSPSWVLEGAPHYQSFHKKTLGKIAEAVCGPLAKVKGRLLSNPGFAAPLTYVCCFNESHWSFLKRIAGETGQWLYNNGKGLVFGKPPKGNALGLVYGQNCHHLKMAVRAAPVQTGVFDYEAGGHSQLSQAANDYTGNIGSYAQDAFDRSKSLFTAVAHRAPASMGADKGLLEVMGRASSAGSAAGLYTIRGSSTVYGLCVGSLVDVRFARLGQKASHSQVRITSVVHSYTAGGMYGNTFTAILASAELPPAIPFNRPQTHPMLAQVLNNRDPQNQGRIQVKFLGWVQQDEQTTDWIRVLTPDAGGGGDKVAKNRGFVTIPEVGDQVMVDFELNNPERPFVTGSVFHGQYGSGGGDSNKTKSLTSRSGNTISLDDAKGSLHAADSQGNMMNMDGAGNIHIKSSSTILLECGDSTVKLESNGNITIKGKEILVVGVDIGISGSTSIGIGVGAPDAAPTSGIAIEATTLDAGTTTLTLSGKTEANLGGATVNIGGGAKTNIASGEVNLN